MAYYEGVVTEGCRDQGLTRRNNLTVDDIKLGMCFHLPEPFYNHEWYLVTSAVETVEGNPNYKRVNVIYVTRNVDARVLQFSKNIAQLNIAVEALWSCEVVSFEEFKRVYVETIGYIEDRFGMVEGKLILDKERELS